MDEKKRRFNMSVWLIAVFLFSFGWDIFWYALGVRPMFPWQLKSALAQFHEKAVLLDVRTPAEYRMFHIKGAQNRPDLIEAPEQFSLPDMDTPVVVICMTGHRSPPVARNLKKRGFRNVRNLTWGMAGWKLFGGPTE